MSSKIAPIDRTVPICGALTGEPGEDEWDRTWRSKTISVACTDAVSNCSANSFSNTFTAQASTGTITIVDNADNSRTCGTRVHLDWTTPKVVVKAYKLTNNSGGHGTDPVKTVTLNPRDDGEHASTNLNSYSGGVGDDNWLNASNFPYGVYYEITTSDNLKLKSDGYKLNDSGLTKDEANDTSAHPLKSQTSSSTNGTGFGFSITAEGYRKASYVVKDAAGNKATINITAPIDRTKPTVSATKSHTGHEDGVHVDLSCSDSMSGCSGASYTKVTKTTSYTLNDVAGNTSDSVSVTVTAQTQHRDCSEHEACECSKDKNVCDRWDQTCKVCAAVSGVGSTSQCWTESSCPPYPMSCSCSSSCGASHKECVEHSRADHCACETWGSWYNQSPCSGSCRTVYN